MGKKKVSAIEDVKKRFAKIAGSVEELPAEEFLRGNFIPYAWSFTLDRALVDETGLKPVQRRILYTMYEDGLGPHKHRSKVATLAGRVLAYHPHGDSSVNDALKNLACAHIFRVPLIDGKGDFGSPGSPGAAGRYIEARLNKAAWINVEELGENAVEMMPNYDSTKKEPHQIPVRWPVSIVNGGSGIAVGYASNMPSHNPTEVMEALIKVVETPDVSDEDICSIIKGPDFNMGGNITSTDGIREYLRSGSGSFKIRGNYNLIDKGRSSYRFEFYEIPYGTHPEKILSSIQSKMDAGFLKEVSSYKDLSDLENPIRVVIDTKPGVSPKKVLQDLFKHTPLETNFSANITTIIDNTPTKTSMRNLLLNFVEFRKKCVRRKSAYGARKKSERLHVVEGLLSLIHIDEAIAIIRDSDDSTIASKRLQKAFNIDDVQAEYILSLQLRRLTKLDTLKLEKEAEALRESIQYYEELINNESALKNHLVQEFKDTLEVIADERKTVIHDMSDEEFSKREKSIASEVKNFSKDAPYSVFYTARGGLIGSMEDSLYSSESTSLKYGPVRQVVKTSTQSNVVLVFDNGDAKRVPSSFINTTTLSDHASLGLSNKIVGVSKDISDRGDIGLAIATTDGSIKVAKTDFPKGDDFPVMSLASGDRVVSTFWVDNSLEDPRAVLVSKFGNILVFPLSSVRPSGSRAGGVRGMKLKDPKDEVVFFTVVSAKDIPHTSVISRTLSTLKLTPLSEIPEKGRGGMGVTLMTFRAQEQPYVVDACAGVSPVATLDGSPVPLVLPPLTRRAGKGAENGMPMNIGLKNLS